MLGAVLPVWRGVGLGVACWVGLVVACWVGVVVACWVGLFVVVGEDVVGAGEAFPVRPGVAADDAVFE